jgi:hypothetical protein
MLPNLLHAGTCPPSGTDTEMGRNVEWEREVRKWDHGGGGGGNNGRRRPHDRYDSTVPPPFPRSELVSVWFQLLSTEMGATKLRHFPVYFNHIPSVPSSGWADVSSLIHMNRFLSVISLHPRSVSQPCHSSQRQGRILTSFTSPIQSPSVVIPVSSLSLKPTKLCSIFGSALLTRQKLSLFLSLLGRPQQNLISQKM